MAWLEMLITPDYGPLRYPSRFSTGKVRENTRPGKSALNGTRTLVSENAPNIQARVSLIHD